MKRTLNELLIAAMLVVVYLGYFDSSNVKPDTTKPTVDTAAKVLVIEEVRQPAIGQVIMSPEGRSYLNTKVGAENWRYWDDGVTPQTDPFRRLKEAAVTAGLPAVATMDAAGTIDADKIVDPRTFSTLVLKELVEQ